MRFIQELANSALEDEYLQKLIEKAEHIYGLKFLQKSVDSVLTRLLVFYILFIKGIHIINLYLIV